MNCNIENIDKLELFNTKLLEFIDFLYSIIPNKKLIKLKAKIKLTLLYDKKTIIDLFITHIEAYKNDILNMFSIKLIPFINILFDKLLFL